MGDNLLKNKNITFNFNGKEYKTLAALKHAQSRLVKQQKKEKSKVAYKEKHDEAKIANIVAKRQMTKETNQFAKDLLNAGAAYNKEKNKAIAANINVGNRDRKKYEKG